MTDKEKIQQAIDIAIEYGQIDGDHHKAWVIDQIIRILTGNKYNKVIKELINGRF